MKLQGIVTATKNQKWLRIIPTEASQFSNAMIEAGEFSSGEAVEIEIRKTGESTGAMEGQ